MYDNVINCVRASKSASNDFLTIGFDQGSTLSHYSATLVLDDPNHNYM